MEPNTKHLLIGILASVALVVLAAFAGAAAHADSPSKKDYTILADVKKNQTMLAKDRAAYQEFLSAKQANEDDLSQLTDGWTVDWSTMTLKPSFQSAQ